jgi:hypothetical protein
MDLFDLPIVILSALSALLVWFSARVVKKAGYSPWWALLGFVPIVNLFM